MPQDSNTPVAVSNRPVIPASITTFTPRQLFVDGDPKRNFRAGTTGTPQEAMWSGLARLLGPEHVKVVDPRDYGGDLDLAKRARGGWVACKLTEGRRLTSSFEWTSLMGFDLDKTGLANASWAFAPFRKIIHGTYKSSDAKPRCRVILLLKEVCTDIGTFKRAHQALRAELVRSRGLPADDDPAGSDPHRLWYFPVIQPGSDYEFEATGGELVDVTAWAARNPPVERKKRTNVPTDAAAALTWAGIKQASASEGTRHHTAFASAAWLAELNATDDEIEAALLPYAPDGREREFKKVISDGIARGRAKAG